MIKEDGIELSAWWVSAHQQPSRGIVLQAHGNAQNMTSHIGMTGFFLHQGFDVLAFDYRGYGISPGQPSRQNTLEDFSMMVRWIEKHHPTQSVMVLAQSLGGAIATTVLSQIKTQNIKLLILDSTFGSYRRVARKKLAGLWLTWPLQFPLSWLISDESSPEDVAEQLRIPVLQIHATDDPVVPISEGRALFASFHPTLQKTWVEYPAETHTEGFVLPHAPVTEAFKKMANQLELFGKMDDGSSQQKSKEHP